MDRTGQVWLIGGREVILVLGPKTRTTQHKQDRWWTIVYLHADQYNVGTEDILFEASDRTWEQRSGLQRIT